MPYVKTAFPKALGTFSVHPVAILTNDMTIAFSPKVHLWYEGLLKVHGEKSILGHVTNMIDDFVEHHGWQHHALAFLHRDQYFATFIVLMMEKGIIFMSPKEAMKCSLPIKVVK